jgi:hypothetical protein
MQSMSELIDLDTLVAVKKAAPKVTQVPFDRAQAALKSLAMFANAETPSRDIEGQKYWSASLKDMTILAGSDGNVATCKQFGTAYRTMGLSMWREMDGYHVAWSEPQLKLLKKYFKL